MTGRLEGLLKSKKMITEIVFSTKERYQLIDITEKVEKIIKEKHIKNGFVLVFVPHSTAAILLTENEEGLKKDWISFLQKMVAGFNFQHDKIDNNADSHIISGLVGQEKTLPIKNGKLVRGTWQQVFLLELDGPRNRKVIIKKV